MSSVPENSSVERMSTLKDAGASLGIPYFKMRKAAKNKAFPTYSIGNRRVLVRLSEVIAAINATHARREQASVVFDPNARLLPFELAADALGVDVAVVREAAGRALFSTIVDTSGLRVAQLQDVAVAVIKVLAGRERTRRPGTSSNAGVGQ